MGWANSTTVIRPVWRTKEAGGCHAGNTRTGMTPSGSQLSKYSWPFIAAGMCIVIPLHCFYSMLIKANKVSIFTNVNQLVVVAYASTARLYLPDVQINPIYIEQSAVDRATDWRHLPLLWF